MKELVQSILVYVVIVSMLKGLISNPKYSQYFQFFSGIIMILIMLSPILSLLNQENGWYDILEENILQMDLENVKAEMEIADGRFEEMVEKEYEETAAKQVVLMAEKEGILIESAEVEVTQEDGELTIGKITVVAGEREALETDAYSIETIRIGEEKKVQEEDHSKTARVLRRKLCDCFAVGEEQVQIWKER